VLELLEVAGEVDGVDPFPKPVLAAMRRLIPADVVSYGELDLGGAGWRAGIRWQGVPAMAGVTPGIHEAHVCFTDQMPHPPWAPTAGRATRWSDLLSRRRLQRLDVDAEVGARDPHVGRARAGAWHGREAPGQCLRKARRR
jgi:hypothetical protein